MAVPEEAWARAAWVQARVLLITRPRGDGCVEASHAAGALQSSRRSAVRGSGLST
ncbi:MAG TPA: hypothetical protein VIF09_22035 [Polyangiaceae bacterium]